MEPGNDSAETMQNRATQPFFMRRTLVLWLFAIVCYWFSKGMLFNDLLANQRLVFFSGPEQQSIWAMGADLALGLSLILAFFIPQSKWPLIVAALLFPCLLFVMTTGARGMYTAPLGCWILFVLLFSSEQSLLRNWKLLRIIAIAGIVLQGLLIAIEPSTMELMYFTDFQKPAEVYFIFTLFAIGFFTQKFDGLLLIILAASILYHGIFLHHPVLPKTLIFAPFLNWTNLHRFFTTRFEPK